jgi:hypothetical protein
VVFDLLDATQLHQNQIRVGGHAHAAPCLAIVVILGQHERGRRFDVGVIERERPLRVDVRLVDRPQLQLYQSDDTIVDDGDELGPYTFAYETVILTDRLQRTDAFGLDK